MLILIGLMLPIGIFYFFISPRYVVPILMYHSIESINPPHPNSVNPEAFAKQMDFIQSGGYKVLSFDELIQSIENNQLPRHSVVVTFDDGYANNYSVAFPLLKEKKIPAMIFITPEQIGQPGYLTWDQIKEMERSGISFGSHTVNHTYLPDASPDEQKKQIVESKILIEKALGHPIDYFAYPSGGFTEAVKEMLKAAGYRAACTTNRGYHRDNKDLYELKRIRAKESDPSFVLWTKLCGFYNFLRKSKSPS